MLLDKMRYTAGGISSALSFRQGRARYTYYAMCIFILGSRCCTCVYSVGLFDSQRKENVNKNQIAGGGNRAGTRRGEREE